MHTPLTFHAVLALIVCFATFAKTQTCAENRCLRRVQHQASGKPNPLRQCKQFFFVTLIPAPTSSTQTSTYYNSTVTIVRKLTKYKDKTTSSTATFPVYETATTTSQPLSRTTFQKRQGKSLTTSSATTLPPYVRGFCANTAAYSSACSCIGAKHSTITAEGRTTTLSTTVTQIKTITIYTTITTSTEYVAQYTTRATYTTTTKTVTTGTAAPTACPQPQPTFKLRVYDAVDYYDGGEIGQYAMALVGRTVFHQEPDYIKGRMVLVAPEDASNFTRAADCSLVSLAPGDTYGLYGNAWGGSDFVYFGEPASLPADSRVRIGFASDSNDAYMEADPYGLVLNSLICLFDYFYGDCQGVSIVENDDYGYVLFEIVLP